MSPLNRHQAGIAAPAVLSSEVRRFRAGVHVEHIDSGDRAVIERVHYMATLALSSAAVRWPSGGTSRLWLDEVRIVDDGVVAADGGAVSS